MLLYPTTETAYKLAKGVVTGEPAPGVGSLTAEFAMGAAAFAGGGKGRPMGEVAREMYKPVRESAKQVAETGKAVVNKAAAEAYGKARLDAMEAKAWAARVMKTVTETVGEQNIEGVRLNPDGFLFKLNNNIDLQVSGRATIGIGRDGLIDTAVPAATSGFEGAAKFSYHIVPEGVNARIALLWVAPADKLRHDIGHLGNRIGAGKKDDAYETVRRVVTLSVLAAWTVGLIVFLAREVVAGWYNLSPAGAQNVRMLMLVMSCILWIRMFNFSIFIGALRAGGDTLFALLMEICSIWLIGVPSAYIGAFVLHLPVYLVYLMVGLEELAKAFVSLWRFRSHKWIHDLVSVTGDEAPPLSNPEPAS